VGIYPAVLASPVESSSKTIARILCLFITSNLGHRCPESYTTVWAQLKASLSNYTQARRWVDMTNFADYMVLSFYGGNEHDWLPDRNWAAAGPRHPDLGGWKFFVQDQDISLQDVNANCTLGWRVPEIAPDGVFTALMAHTEFKVLFRDRVYRHLFNDGALSPAKAGASYQLRANEISDAVVAEIARWQPGSSQGPLPWDRDGEWTAEKNYLLNTCFPQRPAKLITQFRARGWYPVVTMKTRALSGSEWSGISEASFHLPGTQPGSTSNITRVPVLTIASSSSRHPWHSRRTPTAMA